MSALALAVSNLVVISAIVINIVEKHQAVTTVVAGH
jgi:hypothetical protein